MSKRLTLLLRYFCIIIPCVIGLLLPLSTDQPFNYEMYLLCTLLFAGLSELRISFLPARLSILCYSGEIGVAAWMLQHYNNIVGILFTSAIISLPNRLSSYPYFMICTLSMLVMNMLLYYQSPLDLVAIAVCNLLIVTVIIFKHVLMNNEREKQRFIIQNDELRGQTYDLQQARQEVLRYATMVEQFTQNEERNRIAHDLHDELGHRIIRLKLMMDAATQVSASSPEQAAALYKQVQDQLTDVMDIMRSTVQRLKPKDIYIRAYSLEQLIKEYESANIQLQYEVEGTPFSLYPSAEIAIYRNAQEAITNAIRHGHATVIRLVLRYEADQVELAVTNDGVIPDHIRPTGLGIRGMQDRAAALGGTVTSSLTPAFTIHTILPIRGSQL